MGFEGLKSGFAGNHVVIFPKTGAVLPNLAGIVPILSQLTEQHSSP
ncbi:unnamed protein product, partial [marine sediment metagenome]